MRRLIHTALTALSLALIGCGTATGTCGCFADDCSLAHDCEVIEPVCVGDPINGGAENGCGIFVSSSLGDDTNEGTREHPVRTIDKAITLANANTNRVFACGELFQEAVAVPSGVALYGGLDCQNDWVYVGDLKKTHLLPMPDLVPLRIVSGNGESVIADVIAEASDALQPGGSSIAAIVDQNATVEILRSELIAHDGANGADGEDGGPQPAPSGASGSVGFPACSANVVGGGPAVVTLCEDGESVGGKGGDGKITSGDNGADGQPEPIPNPAEWGLGGTGENAIGCKPGEKGVDGINGKQGLGGLVVAARISSAGWLGSNGENGGKGRLAQGGGGGGGSLGGVSFCGLFPSSPQGGASGGSGGAGGCGGKGGLGGGHGGASIGLLSLSYDVKLYFTKIVVGKGGNGGIGGMAQFGGGGGDGGKGGYPTGGSLPGCGGGDGGKGGNGGYGGGGLGGFSLGIAHLPAQAPSQEKVVIELGIPGLGGQGGNPSIDGSAGEDGLAATIADVPPQKAF